MKPIKLKLTKKQLNNNGGSGGLEVKISGCIGDPAEKRPGTSLFLEFYEGKVQVHIWDGTSQDCQTILLK
jgi:hypothetical protein